MEALLPSATRAASTEMSPLWVCICKGQGSNADSVAVLLSGGWAGPGQQMLARCWPAERSWLLLPLAPAVTPCPPPPSDGNQMTTFSRASEVGETTGAGPTPSGRISPWCPGLWILAPLPICRSLSRSAWAHCPVPKVPWRLSSGAASMIYWDADTQAHMFYFS